MDKNCYIGENLAIPTGGLSNGVKRMYDFHGMLIVVFQRLGFNDFWMHVGAAVTLMLGLLVVAYAAFFLFSRVVEVVLIRMARRTKTQWDDAMVKRRVIRHISHMVPGVIIYWGISQLFPVYEYPKFVGFVRIVTSVYMVAMVLAAINAFLNAVHDIYLMYPISNDRPIKTYIQLVKIFFFFIGGIIIISIILRKNPISLILGLGAMSAVLMLIFKDTILGLVASVQASANRLVRPGDWIEMPSRGADGNVLEITLNTVKVQNWDKTISSFPTYALINESFRNWRGMEESNGRLIRRCVYIDATSIHFCREEDLARWRKVPHISRILALGQNEPGEEESPLASDGASWSHTNLGVFRTYVNAYLAAHASVAHGETYMMRLLEPSAQGVPMQVYCYSAKKSFNEYEAVQASILEHIYAAMNTFDLRPAQRITNHLPGAEQLPQ